MKKNDFILIYILLIMILFSSKLPNDSNTEDINFQENILILEESEVQKLPLSSGKSVREIVFSYSKKGVVSIVDMEIEALEVGHTTITATHPDDESIEIKLEVYVVNTPVLTAPKAKIAVGETIQMDFSEEVGASKEDFFWESDNPEVASVDETFTVKGIKNGKATITATYKMDPSVRASYQITVEAKKTSDIDRLVQIALQEEGTQEGYNNDTKYGIWYGANNQEWCAIFVSWAANKAGIDTDIIPKFASVRAGKSFFEERGLYRSKNSYTPKKGDIVFFLNGISHTGIVTKTENGRVYVIEGNSKDMVSERSYLLTNSTITGYGLPDYQN